MSGSGGSTSSASPPQTANTSNTVSNYTNGGSSTFFLQSQDSMSDDLLPTSEHHERARSKRKRTSAADHAILESEYQRNSKPDKAARTAIVERVALNDKEVQIWFQNRRQVTRRKSRPLLPHELFSTLHSSQESTDGGLSSSFVLNSQDFVQSSQTSTADIQLEGVNCYQIHRSGTHERAAPLENILGETHPVTKAETHDKAVELIENSPREGVGSIDSSETTRMEGPLEKSLEVVRTVMDSRTSTSHNCGVGGEGLPSPPESLPVKAIKASEEIASSKPSPSRSLKRTSSSFRLSISLDGKAEVIEDGSTPSPPRVPLNFSIQHRRPKPLQRSQSAIEVGSQPYQDINGTSSWPRRPASGRSRDARAWEFYCDSDVRNALTVQAEQDQKGSASGVLGLIRSSSTKSISLPTAFNSTARQAKQDSSKRKSLGGSRSERPKIARTASSIAKLQTVDHNIQKLNSKAKDKDLKSKSQRVLTRESSGDSDKENWEPDTHPSDAHRRRPLQVQRAGGPPRGVLQENTRVPSHSTSLGVLLNRENPTPRRREMKKPRNYEDKENVGVDQEVTAFMSEHDVHREEVDLACVQNLLSLSQGAWH
ncbi:hypothetical protein MMC26_006761 [Xylographa opegraphella]|nr:hypothetical protein [Xylographa opegraphella]